MSFFLSHNKTLKNTCFHENEVEVWQREIFTVFTENYFKFSGILIILTTAVVRVNTKLAQIWIKNTDVFMQYLKAMIHYVFLPHVLWVSSLDVWNNVWVFSKYTMSFFRVQYTVFLKKTASCKTQFFPLRICSICSSLLWLVKKRVS